MTSRWIGNTKCESGDAVFIIEGVEYELRLDNFEQFQIIETMLAITFKQGKRFAYQAIQGKLNFAMEQAEIQHGLL